MGVLEPAEDHRLAAAVGRDLQGHGAAAHVGLFGEINSRRPPAPEFGADLELGEPFARQTLLAYGAGNETIEALLRRAAAYAAISPLHEILYGLEIADHQHIAEGLAELRTMLGSLQS